MGSPVEMRYKNGVNSIAVSTSNPLPVDSGGSTDLSWNAATFATVGVASAEAVAANSSRVGLILVNDSANTIYLAFGATAAVVGSGIRLNANGGSYEITKANLTTQAVNAIASGAGSNLGVQEGVAV